jgi:hypothetical protein
VKVLKGPVWEGRLANFVNLFDDRKKEIQYELSIQTTLGVNSANDSLANVQKDILSMNAKLDTLLFARLRSPREKDLLAVINAKGGIETCLNDEGVLKELALFDRDEDTPGNLPLATGARLSASESAAVDKAWAKLKPQLKQAVDTSLTNNMVVFERKLDVRKKQLLAEMETIVHREGDRILSAISSGPHDRIIDLVRCLW